MKKTTGVLMAGALLGLGGIPAVTLAQTFAPRPPATQPFAKAQMFLEFNSTDEDTGCHIRTDHGVGLGSLMVVAPNGKTIVSQTWTTRPPLGLTEMAVESAEPDTTTAVRSYPPGVYRFTGRTITGQRLASSVTLSHALLPAAEITSPPDGATAVPTVGAIAAWNPVPGAQSYEIEFEEADGAGKLEMTLPASSTSFGIPDGFLKPGADYKLGVAPRNAAGNLTLATVEFQTAP